MYICDQCGAISEEPGLCPVCGSPLPGSDRKKGRKSPKGSGLRNHRLLALGSLLLAVVLVTALVAGGIAAWNGGGRLRRAAARTLEHMQAGSGLYPVGQRLVEYLEDGKFSLMLSLDQGDLKLDADYHRGKQRIRGQVSLLDLAVEYSVKKDTVQLRLLDTSEVYGFDSEDVNNITRTANKVLDTILPADRERLPTDMKLDFFPKVERKQLLSSLAGEEYRAFRKTVEVENWGSVAMPTSQGYRTYRKYMVSWGAEELVRLLGALSGSELMPNLADFMDKLLPEMEPYLWCGVDEDGCISMVEGTVAGAKCVLILNGPEEMGNGFALKESFTLNVTPANNWESTYHGGIYEEEGTTHLYLSDMEGALIKGEHDRETGRFSLYTRRHGVLAEGKALIAEEEVQVQLRWDGYRDLELRLQPLKEAPQPLSRHHLELENMVWLLIEKAIVGRLLG